MSLMRNTFSLVFIGLVGAGCQQSTSTPATPLAPAVKPVAQPQLGGPEPLASTRRPEAPKLTKNADGSIQVVFVDQWGHDFDATFENADFFKRAIPVVTRGMTAEQVAQFTEATKRLEP